MFIIRKFKLIIKPHIHKQYHLYKKERQHLKFNYNMEHHVMIIIKIK
jgi:hypothetical protein